MMCVRFADDDVWRRMVVSCNTLKVVWMNKVDEIMPSTRALLSILCSSSSGRLVLLWFGHGELRDVIRCFFVARRPSARSASAAIFRVVRSVSVFQLARRRESWQPTRRVVLVDGRKGSFLFRAGVIAVPGRAHLEGFAQRTRRVHRDGCQSRPGRGGRRTQSRHVLHLALRRRSQETQVRGLFLLLRVSLGGECTSHAAAVVLV
jgi:hypothetical protein